MFSIFNVQDEVLSDGLWHHMCIARSYSDGKWTFYSDGVEKLEGVDLGTDYSTEKGFITQNPHKYLPFHKIII